LELYQSDQEKFAFLKPSRQDKYGDTLFHVAAKVEDKDMGLKIVEFLFDKGVDPRLLNNDGKSALQCLPRKNDRFQYSADDKTGALKKKSRPKDFSRQVSEDPGKAMPSSAESSSKITKDKPKTDVKGRRGVRILLEEIQKILDTLDQQYPDYSDDDDYDDDIVEEESSRGLDPAALSHRLQVHISNPPAAGSANEDEETPDTTSEVELATGANRYNVKGRSDDVSGEEQDKSTRKLLTTHPTVDQHEVEVTRGLELGDHGVTGMAGRRKDNTFPEQMDAESDDDSSEEDNTNDIIDPTIFKGLEWEIECTSEVWNILYKKTFDNKMKNRIFKKIKLLGSGEFDNQPHLMKRLHSVPTHIQLYEAKISKAARLIWEIAIAFSSRQSNPANIKLTENQKELPSTGGKPIYAEVIRLWDIVFNHDHISRSVQNVVKSHSKGEECLLQKKLEGIKGNDDCYRCDGKRIPRTFSEVDGGLEPVKFFPPASAKETEYHIMKWYNFDFLVTSILKNQGEKIDFPFSVTEREYAIINIEQKPPLLLLGRSGTGKTTCCLYRLWSKFVRYWNRTVAENPLIPRAICNTHGVENDEEAADDVEKDSDLGNNTETSAEPDNVPEDKATTYDHLHQLFITKNPVLCTEINKNFKCLSHGCREAQPHIDVEDEPLPNRLQLAHHCAYPLFVTSKQFLMILDASLPEPNFFPRNNDGSVRREIAGWGEEDGPLTFIPDMDDDDDIQEDNEEENQEQAAVECDRDRDPRREVTYEIFAEQLWPEIVKNQKEKVTCHPTLVWTEINSFIKGSIEALHSKDGILDLDEYKKLGKKRAPNFPGSRKQVYQLYNTYSILIKRRRWFDEMDLIYNLYARMKDISIPEWYLHEMYVDETQDFTQAELALLIRCCHDPNQMFLTGDTAQSIMRGIAFRFEDLKSLFHYARESNPAKGKLNSLQVPRTVYQLIHNYRSHAGILNLATSLLDLIDRFFPASYDRKGLEKDRGLFDGPRPVVIDCCTYSDLAIVLCGNKRETSQIEFGAHQAILVVNDEARDNLPEELGFGLVLTIYESKGLEFDDILLYNFFKDSQVRTFIFIVLLNLILHCKCL
jgi:hypothetical protein